MQISVEKIVLRAKNLQIEELSRLSEVTQFVEITGTLIHRLQAERGASTIYLASAGIQFADTRLRMAAESESVEKELRTILEQQLDLASFRNAKFLYLLAWVLIGLDELRLLRGRIAKRELAADECIVAISRLIASLISLIFEVADSAVDPHTSHLLVAMFNLVQAKEFAGQERAVGGLVFSSGMCDPASKNRLAYLIDAQERHFQIYSEFASAPSLEIWQKILDAPYTGHLERLRRTLCSAQSRMDSDLSGEWFELCSERLSMIWDLQCNLVQNLKKQCTTLIAEAQSELQDSEGLLKILRTHPPAKAALAGRIFDSAIPVENVLRFQFRAGSEVLKEQSTIDVIDAQAQRLVSMEAELAAAKRALEERKAIERAKGILMARFNLNEDTAYKRMRTASMEQNKRMIDVADAILTMAAFS